MSKAASLFLLIHLQVMIKNNNNKKPYCQLKWKCGDMMVVMIIIMVMMMVSLVAV